MNKKGYTIMEAIVAMFLVVVMVGAVFSALMSGRRAIVTSSEREEVLYSVQSAYGMLKDCRDSNSCHLSTLTDCTISPSTNLYSGEHNLKGCDPLFTFEFNSLCKGATASNDVGVFKYNVTAPTDVHLKVPFCTTPGPCSSTLYQLNGVYDLAITTQCTELL